MKSAELHKTFKRVVALVTTVFICLYAPMETSAQRRQRSKSKPKTTVTSPQKKPQTSAEARKQQEATQKEIKLTEEQIRENDANVKKGLAELGKLDQSIAASNKKIKELNTKLSALKKEIGELEAGISANEKDLEKLRTEYLKAVKKMRVTKKSQSTLAFLFSSNSLNQAMRRMRYLKEFSAWRERQTDEINSKINVLKLQKADLSKAQAEEAYALSLQKQTYAQLADQHTKQELVINKLKSNGEALQAHLKKKQAEASELGRMVSLLIADEQRKEQEEEAKRRAAEEEARQKALAEELRKKEEEKKNQENLVQNQISQSSKSDKISSPSKDQTKTSKNNNNKNNSNAKDNKSNNTEFANARKRAPRGKTNTPSTSAIDTEKISQEKDFPSQRGRLPYPVNGSFAVTSAFGRQTMPDLPNVEFDNPGIDAETEAGASAMAVFKGKVSGVYLLPGYNTVVIVNHGNYYTVYGNISAPSVKTGDTVEMGDNLGRLTLNEEDPSHSSIHFEVWKNREKLNPQDWLR